MRDKDGAFEDKYDYLVSLARALMRFGSPSHRIQEHVEYAGKSLGGVKVTCFYVAVVCFMHFENSDPSNGSHTLKLVREYLDLDLDRSLQTHHIYLDVYQDKLSPKEGKKKLNILLNQTPRYKWWQVSLWGGLLSGSVCSMAFYGSFIDCLAVVPLGFIVTAMQYVPDNDLYANIYE